MPFGYDDDIQPTDVNTTISAVSGSMTVLYNGYLFFPISFIDSPAYSYYPEVKETDRLMYQFLQFESSLYNNEGKDRIGASDKTVAAYFYKFIGTILMSKAPIPMEIKSNYNLSSVGSTDFLSFNEATLESGGSVVLWSDIANSQINGYSGTSYTCEIPSDQEKAWTFDSTGKTSVLKKEVTLASWTAATGLNDSDIPARAEIPTPTKRRYKVAINVESSKNHVILDSADVKAGRLFYCIDDTWYTFSGAASASLELPYGTTIKLAKGSGYNMTGFAYNSDTVSETKTITVNGTNYAVDVYSKSYTVNANNMNIPFYVTPNSYTITCNIGTGISSFNFSTTSKYATSLSKQSYSSNKSFTVYYKDTCSYNGVVETGFETPTPSASNETVSTKTITFTASPKEFRVTVSTVGGITATFNRTSSPYGGAATGNLRSGYDDSGRPMGVAASSTAMVFHNGYSFDAYYGDVFTCTPEYKVKTPTNTTLTMVTKYIDYTSSKTITAATTWSIAPKRSYVTVYLTNTKFFYSDSQYIKYCANGAYKNSSTFSAGTEREITIDAGTPLYMYTRCKANLNPGNTSCAVHTLGSNNPGVYVGTCYSDYGTSFSEFSASLTMSSFSKITALPNSNSNIEVVPAQQRIGNFYLTLAPIIKTFVRGYGIAGTGTSATNNTTVVDIYEYTSSTSDGYMSPHTETYSGTPSVTSYTTCITSTALLHSTTTHIDVKWSISNNGVPGKVSFNPSPDTNITNNVTDAIRTYSLANTDSTIPNNTIPTYGPYASVKVKPYLNVSYFSWGNKYALYNGAVHTFRTMRRQYDGTSNLPGIGYTASGNGSVSNLGTYLYYSGSTGSISYVSSYLSAGSGISMYDSFSTQLSRSTFLSSTGGSDPKKYSLSGAKFYAIFDFISTSNKIESKLKAHLNDSLIIDYVYNYKTNNY